MNIYKNILKNNINKLLNLYNLDTFSQNLGVGDRLYWGWKCSDFLNGTYQGGVHALAIAIKLGLIQNESFVLKTIDHAIRAIPKVTTKKGGTQEAYPYEHSFCVTALVAFDSLSAIEHLENRISPGMRDQYREIIRPLISFINANIEQHAIISNHLATAAAANFLWKKIFDNNHKEHLKFLDIIYKHQSEEGWYIEYDGADPGYQTLCTHYLFSIFQEDNSEALTKSLEKSASFLQYCIHPDLTLGGLYASRNTEVYYPGGVVGLSKLSPAFSSIAYNLHIGIEEGNHVDPHDIDVNNYIPLINSYAVAALHYEKSNIHDKTVENTIPFTQVFEKNLPKAGLLIKSTDFYYAIINYKKGGAVKVFNKENNKIDCEDGGLFGILENGRRFSTQQYSNNHTFNNNTIHANFYLMSEAKPNPFNFLILRILVLTFLRIKSLNILFKNLLVKFLMKNKALIDGRATRSFKFTEKNIIINENIASPKNCKFIGHHGKSSAIHMASSGYFLKQVSELPHKPKIVEIL